MPHITVNDVRLFYEGTGAGEPLVLVHGGFSDHGNFRAVVGGLAETFRVVAYDRRGHSLSERPAPLGSRRDQEDDLTALVETLDIGPAHVVGTSFGSAVALGLAGRRPDLVRTLTAHEPALPALSPRGPAVQAAIRAALARVDAEGGTQQFLEDVALGPGAWARFPEPIKATMVRSAPAVLKEQADAAWGDVDRDALSNLRTPILLTKGGQSPPWFADVVAELAGLIPGARVHRYPDAGHSPHITDPDAYVAVVTAFAAEGVATHA